MVEHFPFQPAAFLPHETEEGAASLEAFLKHAPAAAAYRDGNGRVAMVNARMAALLGKSREEILDHPLETFLPPGLLEEVAALDGGAPAEGPCLTLERECLLPGGAKRVLLVHLFPVEEEAGRRPGLGILATDVSDLEEAERRRRDSLRLLAGGIAHDFNNLLGGILGNAELGLLEPKGPGRALQAIKDLVGQAAHLTRQMLAYAGQGRFRVVPVGLSGLMEEMAQILRHSIPAHMTLQVAAGRDLPAVEGDPSQIQQVILSLVGNAVEAIGESPGGTILLRTAFLEGGAAEGPGEPHVMLSVTDTGCGMGEDTRRRMFEPFFSTRCRGRGLGLAAVQGIVRGHHGFLQVDSEPGRGSTVSAFFPAVFREVPGPAPAPAAYRGEGTVLLVDDEEYILVSAGRLLRHLGFQVLEARDGQEALRVYEGHQDEIRLILLDLTMKGMGGGETLRRLRRMGSRVPVILSSGYPEADAALHLEDTSPLRFLQKPYDLPALVEALRLSLP
jgi:PAS domain S-box-containing protein